MIQKIPLGTEACREAFQFQTIENPTGPTEATRRAVQITHTGRFLAAPKMNPGQIIEWQRKYRGSVNADWFMGEPPQSLIISRDTMHGGVLLVAIRPFVADDFSRMVHVPPPLDWNFMESWKLFDPLAPAVSEVANAAQ